MIGVSAVTDLDIILAALAACVTTVVIRRPSLRADVIDLEDLPEVERRILEEVALGQKVSYRFAWLQGWMARNSDLGIDRRPMRHVPDMTPPGGTATSSL